MLTCHLDGKHVSGGSLPPQWAKSVASSTRRVRHMPGMYTPLCHPRMLLPVLPSWLAMAAAAAKGEAARVWLRRTAE